MSMLSACGSAREPRLWIWTEADGQEWLCGSSAHKFLEKWGLRDQPAHYPSCCLQSCLRENLVWLLSGFPSPSPPPTPGAEFTARLSFLALANNPLYKAKQAEHLLHTQSPRGAWGVAEDAARAEAVGEHNAGCCAGLLDCVILARGICGESCQK